jgi:hypothetical protein
VATDDLHAPLGLEKPAAAGRSIVYSVAAAALGIAAAAIVIGAAAWYESLAHSLPTPAPATAATPAAVKPEPAVVVGGSAMPRGYTSGTTQPPSQPMPQGGLQGMPQIMPRFTGSIPAAGAPPQDQPAAPGGTDRIITIIDGRSGARQEVRIPATSDAADAPPPDPGLADLTRTAPSADEGAEPPPQPSRAKPNAPQKRAKPGQTMSTNSASQAPLR